MKPSFFRVCLSRTSALLLIVSAVACKPALTPVLPTSGAGAVVGVNYTDHGIQWFNVDGAGGMRLGTYSGGGGHVCCASYPRTWTPDYNVKVKWARSDGSDDNGQSWKIKELEKVIAVPKYVEEGSVYVLFLPGDEVKVFVSAVGVGSPNFPTNPGYPRRR
jgi:hypothetical protein